MSDELFKSQYDNNVTLTKDWAKYLMHRMGLVKRRASTKAKISIENFEEVKKFFYMTKCLKLLDEIPDELTINFDQTGIDYVPVSSWTMEKQGEKRVEIISKDDNTMQITAVLAGTLSGEFIPVHSYQFSWCTKEKLRDVCQHSSFQMTGI